ncbi:MAG: hypothetical protein CMD65_02580 [Gammaproteobacteria bacterium]|nr:hypothetical protein [Gammaproteobacteria bacterium]
MKREISYFTELEKWYKKTPGSGFKKYILEEIHNLRDYSQGNNVLYLGPSEFSKKFQFKSHLSFIFFDDFNLSNHIKNQQKMPFGDNSHDLIIIVHTLDYVQNPYELVREIDRIATDGAKIILIGFNKSSIWGLIKPFMKKQIPWNLNYHSIYAINEWFKLLGYERKYHDTTNLIPYFNKNTEKFFDFFKFFQKLFLRNFGGTYFLVFHKKSIPYTTQKIKFNQKYIVSPFAKKGLNRVK